jgi:hypothetical protein
MQNDNQFGGNNMSKLIRTLLTGFLALGVAATAPGVGYAGGNDTGAGSAPGTRAVGDPVIEALTFSSAHDVFQIRSTTAAGSMTVSVQDCCIAGDQWVQRTYCLHNSRVWDVRGKGNGLTTGAFTGATQVFKNGGQPIECVTEVRYGEGVSVFPAGMNVKFDPVGTTVTTTILSTLAPLPSQ